MADDSELLRCYAQEGSEGSFRELVRRHFDFVYSAALRQVAGDSHLAQDVAQGVFTILARKAASIARNRPLEGWLYVTTRSLAAQAVRNERRWRARGAKDDPMSGRDPNPPPEIDWERVRPLLETALFELGDLDREALLIRFFKGRPYAEVGEMLGLSSDAARMRVERALERLRARFEGLGVTSSASALAALMAGQAVAAAPAGMATAAAGAALAGAGAGSTGLLAFMSIANLKTGIAGALVLAGLAAGIAESREHFELAREAQGLAGAQADLGRAERENTRLKRLTGTLSGSVSEERAVAENLRSELAAAQAGGAGGGRASARTRTSAAGVTAPTYDIGALDQLPFAVDQVRPHYPPEMRAGGQSAKVMVDFVVGVDGNVVGAHAVPFPGSSRADFTVAANGAENAAAPSEEGQKQFEAAAVEAVSQWIFEPGQKAGSAVNTHMQVPIVYTLAH